MIGIHNNESNCKQGRRQRNGPWTEDEVSGQFPSTAFNLERDCSAGNGEDVIAHLPRRKLQDWYLKRQPTYIEHSFPEERVRLPLETQDLTDYVLIGRLEPMHPKQEPIDVELSALDYYIIDQSSDYRGYWVITRRAKYWLKKPCTKRIKIPRFSIRIGDEYISCGSRTHRKNIELPSQEQLHLFHRAQLGLLSNLMDILVPPPQQHKQYDFYKQTPQQVYDILSPSPELMKYYYKKQQQQQQNLEDNVRTLHDHPFDIDLLLSSKFLHEQIALMHPNLRNSTFLKSLQCQPSKHTLAKHPSIQCLEQEELWRKSAELAEERSLRYSWGGSRSRTKAFHQPLSSVFSAFELELEYQLSNIMEGDTSSFSENDAEDLCIIIVSPLPHTTNEESRKGAATPSLICPMDSDGEEHIRERNEKRPSSRLFFQSICHHDEEESPSKKLKISRSLVPPLQEETHKDQNDVTGTKGPIVSISTIPRKNRINKSKSKTKIRIRCSEERPETSSTRLKFQIPRKRDAPSVPTTASITPASAQVSVPKPAPIPLPARTPASAASTPLPARTPASAASTPLPARTPPSAASTPLPARTPASAAPTPLPARTPASEASTPLPARLPTSKEAPTTKPNEVATSSVMKKAKTTPFPTARFGSFSVPPRKPTKPTLPPRSIPTSSIPSRLPPRDAPRTTSANTSSEPKKVIQLPPRRQPEISSGPKWRNTTATKLPSRDEERCFSSIGRRHSTTLEPKNGLSKQEHYIRKTRLNDMKVERPRPFYRTKIDNSRYGGMKEDYSFDSSRRKQAMSSLPIQRLSFNSDQHSEKGEFYRKETRLPISTFALDDRREVSQDSTDCSVFRNQHQSDERTTLQSQDSFEEGEVEEGEVDEAPMPTPKPSSEHSTSPQQSSRSQDHRPTHTTLREGQYENRQYGGVGRFTESWRPPKRFHVDSRSCGGFYNDAVHSPRNQRNFNRSVYQR